MIADREVDLEDENIAQIYDVQSAQAKQGVARYLLFRVDENSDAENFMIVKGGMAKIAKKFETFKINKMQKDSMTKASQPQSQPTVSDKVMDKPKISETSQRLANARRERLGIKGSTADVILKQQ